MEEPTLSPVRILDTCGLFLLQFLFSFFPELCDGDLDEVATVPQIEVRPDLLLDPFEEFNWKADRDRFSLTHKLYDTSCYF